MQIKLCLAAAFPSNYSTELFRLCSPYCLGHHRQYDYSYNGVIIVFIWVESQKRFGLADRVYSEVLKDDMRVYQPNILGSWDILAKRSFPLL